MKHLYLLLFLLPATLFGQDPAFSKYNSSLLLINPAFAGSWACGRAEVGYRNQWPGISANYQTLNVSADGYQRYLGGFGVNYMHDVAGQGTIKTDRIDLVWSPSLAIQLSSFRNPVIVKPAVSLAWQQKSIDWSRLSFGDMIDPRRGFVYNTNQVPGLSKKSIADVSAGLLLHGRRVAAGIATYHLTEPDEGFLGPSKLPMRYVMHASGIIGNLDDSARHFRVVPSFIFMKQQDFESLVLNANFILANVGPNTYSLGIGYRNQDALIFSAGWGHGHVRISYSYDLTVSKLTNHTGGSHEVHLTANFLTAKWKDRVNLRQFN